MEDLADFDEWLRGSEEGSVESAGEESAEESTNKDEVEEGSTADEDSDQEQSSGDEANDENGRKLALQSLKRKRSVNPSQAKAKKRPFSSAKGPKVEIEYEMERTEPSRELLRA